MRPSWCAPRPGRIIGALAALLIVMKGLPLTYSKDMQEDKEPVFDALDSLALALAAMTGMVDDLRPDVERCAQAAARGYATATDLADWLVRVLNCRSARPITSPAGSSRWPRARAGSARICRSPMRRHSSRRSTRKSSRF